MRIALAQINNTVGDLDANAAKILDFARQAERAGAEAVAFPELALTGYPPRDLVEKYSFLARTEEALQAIAKESANLKTSADCRLCRPRAREFAHPGAKCGGGHRGRQGGLQAVQDAAAELRCLR